MRNGLCEQCCEAGCPMPKPRKRLCRAWVNSDCGREYCQGFSGHKMHWYKIWGTGEVIYWAARGRVRGGKR